MKTRVTLSIIAVMTSFSGLTLAQGEAPPAAPEAPAGAAAPTPPPPAAAPPPAPAPAPGPAPAPEADAHAGGARTHDGFFFRIGLNGGPLMLSWDAPSDPKWSGFQSGFDLLIGGSPVDGLAIGGALIANRTTDPTYEVGGAESTWKGSMLFAGLALFADWYLNPHEGLHFQGLVGFAAVDFVSDSGQSGGNDPTGTMFGLGAGYDFWISNQWSIGPFGRVIYSSVSAEAGGATAKYSYLYPSIGVAFTLH
ncbi:MAG: autotransporter domain-containing protein [Polyangiaceae bacterium]|nr:autotransporter domain-containing protein [Polyangiaceae bacterium]